MPDAVFSENATSPILPWLSEKEWFPKNGIDIALIKNNRYCPPFWHELEFVKIICVMRGNAHLFVENKVLTISEGNLCIVYDNNRIVSGLGSISEAKNIEEKQRAGGR